MSSEQHYYCQNLIEVNKKESVVTNQPIYNDHGVLLLAQGASLDEKRAAVLLQHKLMKPLEECVGIASSLDARQFFALLNKFAQKIPGLHAVTDNDQYQHSLRQACLFYEKYPLLKQNLTVMALRAPTIYYQGLYSALAGLAIARRMNLSLRDLQTTFIAGLFHDVGFLYLPQELLVKTHNFTAEEWKALQAHPLIAQRFLTLIPDLPKEIGIAIAEHHERIDGTGYPRHIFGEKMSMVSQIIAATDNIITNYNRYNHYGDHTHLILLTALKLSDNIYFDSVFDAAMVLFKHAQTPTTEIAHAPSIAQLLARQKMLRQQFESAKFLAQQLIKFSSNPLVRSVNAVMGRLAVSIARSGILQSEQEEWIAKVNSDTLVEDGLHLAEVSVMHDQIYDQLVHIKNLMERVVENIASSEPHFNALNDTLQKINLNETAFAQ